MRSTFKVLFYLKRNAPKKNGLVPVMCRVTVNGKISQFSCKLDVEEKSWNVKLGRMSGRSTVAEEANRMLDKIRAGINKAYQDICDKDNYVTAEKVRNAFWGMGMNHETLLTVFRQHNEDYHKQVGSDSFIACKTPQLFTDKKDHELDYCLIKIQGSQITEIVYREWFSKRNKFRAGLSFTESDSGIISFVPETIINSSLEEIKVSDEVEILLKDKFQQDMIAYSGQPTIDWIDCFLSQKRIDRDRSATHSEMISEEELFDNPRNIKILTPAEFGLTCYGRHFLLSLWQKRKQFGVLVEKVGLKKTKIENYVDAILKEFNKVAAEVKWIILDEWNVTAKESQAILPL